MKDKLWREDFAKNLATNFRIEFVAGQLTLTKLIEVSEVKCAGQYESFAIVLMAPNGVPPIPQTYPVRHPALGEFHMFLSPFGEDEDGIKFEAIFDRLI
jgi:hypothetical protein